MDLYSFILSIGKLCKSYSIFVGDKFVGSHESVICDQIPFRAMRVVAVIFL